jgi:serine/threonine protein kinase
MANKRGKQGGAVKHAAPKRTAKTHLSADPAAGDTRIKVIVPGAEAGEPSVGLDTANYPPSAVLKVEGDHEYEIARLVARGGMGVIYEAKDRSCERFVAVKLMTGVGAPQHRACSRARQ